MSQPLSLIGGTVLHPDGTLAKGDVHIADGVITDSPSSMATQLDCRGLHILPGIIDLHGDAFEQELHPRPGIDIAFAIAMRSVDRQLISNGITTAYHGLTLSWEPGARSLPAARAFMSSLAQESTNFLADHRVQLRWEVFAHDALDDIATWLAQDPTPALAFNDHTTGTLSAIKTGGTDGLESWAKRANLTLDAYLATASQIGARARDVPGKIREVAELARRHNARMLAHDEVTVTDRQQNRALGMTVSEFPLTRDAASDAVQHGEHTIMGAPNVLRGISHKGNLRAEDAIRDGLCTVLASDYYYPSLLHAAEHLTNRGVLPLSHAWALISSNPALAMGLLDRGAIRPGARADLVALETTGTWRPRHVITLGIITSFGALFP